ncbi:MAG: hypothetical protein IPN17_06890 [Deltaproteobacteria bacterium]|nr:hypothetical protein [Deltaproteobacteria bacterium]
MSEPVGAMAHGQILVTRSDDLEHWSTPSVALQDPSLSFGWGNLESPTVAVRDDGYYLFVTRTSEAPIDYARTVVFHSTDPARFAWAPVTEMLTHAAEVFEVDGQSYITAAGWTSMLGARWRGALPREARLGEAAGRGLSPYVVSPTADRVSDVPRPFAHAPRRTTRGGADDRTPGGCPRAARRRGRSRRARESPAQRTRTARHHRGLAA